MKEKNEFPNIKPTKLKEETNKNIINKISKTKKIKTCNDNYKGINYCIIYLLIFISVISFFIWNYTQTKDAFKENKFINLPYEKLCNGTIKTFRKCIADKSYSKCLSEQRALEICYYQAYSMNQNCFAFVSELELCLRKSENNYQKCYNHFQDVVKCGSAYKNIDIDKDIKEFFKEVMN